jgi:hypothetical protein
MHYNAGWADGHHWDIQYWEVWNEPNIQKFWTGTPDQFFRLYERVARALKAHDPSLKVGTCGLAGGYRGGPYREGLIAYCAHNNVPLDFYSWHLYHGTTFDPYDMTRVAHIVRRLLDDHGFRRAESHVTEWNLALGRHGIQHQVSMEAASFTATALMYLQDAPVDMAHYYRGDAGHGMSLLNSDGSYRKKAYGFQATGVMLDTPRRLAVTGGDTVGFAVLAGLSDDDRVVQILIGNHEIRPRAELQRPPRPGGPDRPAGRRVKYTNNRGYVLTVDGLPWAAEDEYTLRRFRVPEGQETELVEDAAGKGNTLKMSYRLPPPAIELIVIQRK